jgi:acetyl esterase
VQNRVPRVLLRLTSVCGLFLGLALPAVSVHAQRAPTEVPDSLPQGQPIKPTPVPPSAVPWESTDPQIKDVLDQMSAAGLLNPATLDQARQAFLFYSKFAGPPEQVFRVDDRFAPGPAGEISIRVYQPRAGSGLPIFVFFHGGGFVSGGLNTHDSPLRAITNRCDCIVVSVAYRLAPENHYPAATDDAYAATKWVAEHAQDIGGDPRRIAVGGDGTGGNLAAVVAQMARDRKGPMLMYQVLIYPSLDPSMLTYSWIASRDPIQTSQAELAQWSVYIPIGVDPATPYIAPVNGNLHNLPPAYMIVGTNDPARDEDRRYSGGLQAAGVHVDVVSFDNVVHGFFLMAGKVDAGKKAIDDVGAALKQAFQSGK